MTSLQIVDLSVSLVIAILLIVIVMWKLHRIGVILFLTTEIALTFAFYWCGLPFAFYLTLAILIISFSITFYVNISEIRTHLINPFNKKGGVLNRNVQHSTQVSNYVENKEDFVKKISTAVKWLSDTRTGALITFERSNKLDSFIKTGTVLNAPVTPELIETIFYEGTRLHDGAVVIRGNTIVAASVFYEATTRPLVGKYGARHRAALGIAEVTDSITIIVSEETGNISLAIKGRITRNYDSKKLKNILLKILRNRRDKEDKSIKGRVGEWLRKLRIKKY